MFSISIKPFDNPLIFFHDNLFIIMFTQFDSIVLPPIHDNKKLFLPLPQPQPQAAQQGQQVNVNSNNPNNRNIGQPVNVHYIHHHHYHHDPLNDNKDTFFPKKNDVLIHPNPILPPLHQKPFNIEFKPLHLERPNSALNKISKPRKKKQCPECHLFFSNLSTHKSTHLSPQNRPFQCNVCQRGFSRSNDLYRHEKRHWKETGSDEGAYKCPFNTILLSEEERKKLPTSILPCHSTGIFSRCDTYKNHLKALHFEYPLGTKKKMRNGIAGTCKLCGKAFNNVDEWLITHVETGDCHL